MSDSFKSLESSLEFDKCLRNTISDNKYVKQFSGMDLGEMEAEPKRQRLMDENDCIERSLFVPLVSNKNVQGTQLVRRARRF